METLSATQDDSSGANPSSVKSDDSSPRHDSSRGSPPPNCAICLGTCRNKSFTDSCLHQFCFKCLLTWSKVKAECPLCKQNFRSIIHNVRSNHQYEEYMVEQRQTEDVTERIEIDSFSTATRRFRYRTTLTLPRRETIAIQQLLLHYPLMTDVFPPAGARLPAARLPVARRRRSPASFRRTVYRHNLWARPLPDFTGRFRDCTPDFYRYNDTQMHRLMPWLNRELHYLLNENVGHISYVMTRILELLPQYHISSPEFREAMRRFFGERTEHFLHELYCFASTPYDMTGYDRNVQYTTDSRISTMVNEVISSSESDASVDSDIVMVSSSEPVEPPAGPSGLPPPVYPDGCIPRPAAEANRVIPIETISHSDTDDDSSEVMVVGYIKPPQERTPEVVDLLGSDSDVVVQDTVPPEPAPAPGAPDARPAPAPAPAPLVKLTLKRQRARADGESDSDESAGRPAASRRRRRARSGHSATTADTCRTTPSPAPPPPAPAPAPANTPPHSQSPAHRWDSDSTFSPAGSVYRASVASSPTTTTTTDTDTDSSDEYSLSDDRRCRVARKKSKKKSSKETTTSRRDRKKSKKRSSRGHRRERKVSRESQTERDKRSKRKSHSGKGVKSSKKNVEPAAVGARSPAPTPAPAPAQASAEQPSTSGTSGKHKKRSGRERKLRQTSRENKRLRSVVNVMYSHKNAGESSSNGTSASSVNSKSSNESMSGDDNGRRGDASHRQSKCAKLPAASRAAAYSSDSEDDLPLNLTVQKTYPVSSL